MCGIALILSGVHIIRPDLDEDCVDSLLQEVPQEPEPEVSADDLKAILRRRGPDSVGTRKVFLSISPTDGSESGLDEPAPRTELLSEVTDGTDHVVAMDFIGATLQLRGEKPVCQPLVDGCGNHLLYNGEIFGGIYVDAYQNDSKILLKTLECCSSCDCQVHAGECNCTVDAANIPHVLSTIRGPWSFIYWQSKSRTLWFGRDPFGRRSLLIHWPTSQDIRFMLSSVAPSSLSEKFDGRPSNNSFKNSDMTSWDELPCGVYSMQFGFSNSTSKNTETIITGEVKKYEWTDPLLKKLITRKRSHVDPTFGYRSKMTQLERESSVLTHMSDTLLSAKLGDDTNRNYTDNLVSMGCGSTSYSIRQNAGASPLAYNLVVALTESVKRRTILTSTIQRGKTDFIPIAVLFSGGLDSMIIAALLDKCLSPTYTIDLLNVSFDGQNAPDRISGRAGLMELKRISPTRRWRLVEIDADLMSLSVELQHVMALIKPSMTYMDLNIGIALWLAARGEGFVVEDISELQDDDCSNRRYQSTARILLVGSGADEQCAGYGRHRTKYRAGSWRALEEEMTLDMQRIWKRNLGRDDRCISDHGKEARFPFLDEDVVELLLDFPLWEIANLDEPVGRGDKKILREVAKLLGLEGAATLPKRAIQFGSRIARESNKQHFGSNRAANQASAGSVMIGKSSR